MTQVRGAASTRFSADDQRWMLHVIRQAHQGRGNVEPNPMVAAAVVANGKCVGEGYHQQFGGPHAEVHALAAAGEAARGATLYVNLEPCCHQGKTPPCTDAVIKAGVSRVVCAMLDPFDQVAGRGVAALQAAGIQVDVGCGEPQARQLNSGYLTLLGKGRPEVLVKWAQTLDGKISAPRLGRFITSEAARAEAHRLRAQCQAILVGAGTVTADDPQLTTRDAPGKNPHRFVIDGQLRTPTASQLVASARTVPLTIFTTASAAAANAGQVKRFRECNVEVVELGDRPPIRWADLLRDLGRRRLTHLLVEGGQVVLRALLNERLADQAAVFIAPTFAGPGLSVFDDNVASFRLNDVRVRHFGPDALIEGRIDYL